MEIGAVFFGTQDRGTPLPPLQLHLGRLGVLTFTYYRFLLLARDLRLSLQLAQVIELVRILLLGRP